MTALPACQYTVQLPTDLYRVWSELLTLSVWMTTYVRWITRIGKIGWRDRMIGRCSSYRA